MYTRIASYDISYTTKSRPEKSNIIDEYKNVFLIKKNTKQKIPIVIQTNNRNIAVHNSICDYLSNKTKRLHV